jgi:1-acyl-sn-glycerol-3-phosphate acyltransferase
VPIAPTTEQLALLRPFERLAFRFCDRINSTPWRKRVMHGLLRRFGAAWVSVCTKKLLVLDGLEHVLAAQPPRGTLLVANHRSFFDLYVVSAALFRHTKLLERMYFPVRSTFFYDHPAGLLLNGIMSGWAMYPPILRQPERSEWNKYATARIAELLQAPGNVVGFHPEGTRNKTDDPYTLLPAHPGVGQLIYAARPTVIPLFIHGLGNQFLHQIKTGLLGSGRKIIIAFGKPIELEPFYAQTGRLRTYMAIAKHVREVLTGLGERERAVRAELEGGAPLQDQVDEQTVLRRDGRV